MRHPARIAQAFASCLHACSAPETRGLADRRPGHAVAGRTETKGIEVGRRERGGERGGRDQQRVPACCCAPPPRHRRAPPPWPLFASHTWCGQSTRLLFSTRDNAALVCHVLSPALSVVCRVLSLAVSVSSLSLCQCSLSRLGSARLSFELRLACKLALHTTCTCPHRSNTQARKAPRHTWTHTHTHTHTHARARKFAAALNATH